MSLDLDPNHIFRDFVIDGMPASGANHPRKVEIRQWTTSMWQAVIALLADANPGLALPNLLIRYTVTGGTADAIVATPNLAPPAGPGLALFSIQIAQPNTGPVTINGKSLHTNSGHQIAPGGLVAGGIYLFLEVESGLRLVSDQASAAVLAQAEAAADRAEEAEANALGLLGGVTPVFPSRVLAEAYAPDAAPGFMQLAGYYSAGDGGRALYRQVASEPSHAGKFSITLSDGVTVVWYEIAEATLTPQMFGAKGDGASDDSQPFQDAVDTLPVSGGKIQVPPAKYVIDTEPDWGAKSIYWDISTAAEFIGDAVAFHGFPFARSNFGQRAAGPFIQSQSYENTDSNGGIAALTVEMIQPADYGAGQSVAIYGGAVGTNPDPSGNVWAANFLVAAETGSAGTYHGIEVDVNTISSDALTKGIGISGGGTVNADVGVEITRLANLWERGVHILKSQDGLVVDMEGRGIVVHASDGQVTPSVKAAFSARQNPGANDTLLLQRSLDVGAGGHLIRAVNAANSVNLFSVDVLGNVSAASMRVTGSAPTVSAGEVAFGAAVQPGGALPGNPAGYIIINVGGTGRLLPFWAA